MEYIISRATTADVEGIFRLTTTMAADQLMLARSKYKIATMLPSFFVARTADGAVLACGSCSVLWTDLAEICALAVVKKYQGRGIGAALVKALIEEARRMAIPKLVTLTYQVQFFENLGFTVIDKDAFPRKVWRECLECPKLEACDETALFLDL